MAAEPWVVYDQFMLDKNDGTQDLDNDAFAVRLLSISYVPDPETDTAWADMSATEIATNFGYIQGGVAVTPTLVKTANNIAFSFSDVAGWVANGGTISTAWAIIVNTSFSPERLVAYCMLDDTATPSATTVDITNTNAYNIDFTNGVFNESRV